MVALLAVSCVDAPTLTSPNALIITSPGASIKVGETVQLTATAKPGAAASFSWASSNESVATVSQSGVVTGVTGGIATITASAGESTGSTILSVLEPGQSGSATLLAAGDIATCTNDFDEATARILDANPSGIVAPLGDNAYVNGSASEFANCYAPTWGRHLSRTMPAVGNHEYQTADAAGYYGYFGSRAGDPAKG